MMHLIRLADSFQLIRDGNLAQPLGYLGTILGNYQADAKPICAGGFFGRSCEIPRTRLHTAPEAMMELMGSLVIS